MAKSDNPVNQYYHNLFDLIESEERRKGQVIEHEYGIMEQDKDRLHRFRPIQKKKRKKTHYPKNEEVRRYLSEKAALGTYMTQTLSKEEACWNPEKVELPPEERSIWYT